MCVSPLLSSRGSGSGGWPYPLGGCQLRFCLLIPADIPPLLLSVRPRPRRDPLLLGFALVVVEYSIE